MEIASHYNVANPVAPLTLLPLVEERGLATVIANPIGAGRLVSLESFRAAGQLPGGLPLSEAEPLLERLMAQTGRQLFELALLFLLDDPWVTCSNETP